MGRSGPSVAAVVPVYNRATVIGEAVASIRAQTHRPAEIVVVDDGSTDGTVDAVRALGSDIRLLCTKHGGASHARNTGVGACTADWIAFLDSDDTWAPEYLERMVSAVEATEGSAALYFSRALLGSSEAPVDQWDAVGFSITGSHKLFLRGGEVVLNTGQPMLLPFTLIRRASFQQIGGLAENLAIAEDTHLFLRLGLTEPLCAVNTVGGTVHDRSGTERLSRQYGHDAEARWEHVITMCRDLLDHLRLRGDEAGVLKGWMAEAHWRLARVYAAQGRGVVAARAAAAAFRALPSLPMRLLGRQLGRDRGPASMDGTPPKENPSAS